MWLHVPASLLSESSPSSAEEVASISASSERRMAELVLWCTSSGKPTARPLSWRGWKKRPWVKRLSGTTSPLLMLELGVVRWISSLAARPVRTSASPVSAQGSTESEVASSSTTRASPTSQAPARSSGRTWAGPQAELFSASSTNSRLADSTGRVSRFVLLTWERPSVESDFLSWPTAVTTDARSSGRSSTTTDIMHPGTSLTDRMREWATPAASLINYNEEPETFEARSARLVEEGTRPLGANLGQQGKAWHTATTRNVHDGAFDGRRDLQTDVANWATPQARDMNGRPKEGVNQSNLVRDAQQWTNGSQTRDGAPSSAKANWPTAAATDFKGSTKVGQRRGQLSEAILKNGHHDPTMQEDGDESSPSDPSSPRLNPAFVEWLMGWPPGWSLATPVRRTGPIV